MSHYAVAVFSDDGDFDRLLKPYNECDENYFVFKRVDYQDILDEFDRFKKQNPAWTLEMYINEFKYIQKDGHWGYMHNPQGYWDWYNLDGKDYLFNLKKDVNIDEQRRKNDYEWYHDDKAAAEEAQDFWNGFVEDNDDDYPSFWNREYYLERYKTKEQFVKEMRRTIPYAFITPDGVWHASGRVGFFASSNETADDADRYADEWYAWIENDANPYVNLVDCHI